MVKNTMKPMIKCANCGRIVPANPRVKNQKYCNRKACQRVRKNKWKQSKIAYDPDYKNDQRDQVKKILAEMKREKMICVVGKTSAARWYPGTGD